MVKKKPEKNVNDKFFKYFLMSFVIIVIVAAILLNNEEEKQIVVVNQGDVIMNYFYLETCPHCKEQEEFHKILLEEYPNLKIIEYEMTKESSREKYLELGGKVGLDTDKIATPTTIIGNEYNVGFLNAQVTGIKLRTMINDAIAQNKLNQNLSCDE